MLCAGLASFVLIGLAGCGNDDAGGSLTKPPTIPIIYPDLDDYPRWSADGSRIVYFHRGIVEVKDGGVRIDPAVVGLWSVDTLGTTTFRLNATDIHGEVSNMGESVAFSAAGQLFAANLTLTGIDTLSIRRLTSGGTDFFPSWSPDDSLIAYESNMDSKGYRVHVIDLRGDEVLVLPIPSRDPDWFPDGVRLAYSWTRPAASTDLAVYDLQDSSVSNLTDNGLVRDESPQVSPAGDKILYTRGNEIWLMDADGRKARFLIKGHAPTWAPDGRRFAFVYRPDAKVPGLGTIWVSDIDGASLTPITLPQYKSRILLQKCDTGFSELEHEPVKEGRCP